MKTIFYTLSLLFILNSFVWAKGLQIEVGKAGSKKSGIAFSPFIGKSKIDTKKLKDQIAKNLEFTSYFREVKSDSLKKIGGTLNADIAKKLKNEGVEFLIAGSSANAGKQVVAQFKVYFLEGPKLVTSKVYRDSPDHVRDIANKFSDDLMLALTGKKSIFNTNFAVTSDRVGNQWKEVYTMNWDGSDLKRKSFHKASSLSPNWSPGGNQIVYSAITVQPKTGTRNANLYIYDQRSGKRSLLSSRPGINSGGAFFPDGKSLAMTLTQGGVPDLFRISLAGSIIDRLTKGPGKTMNVEASISPDGSKVAFSSDRSGRPMLYVMDLANKVPKRLTFAGRYNSAPSWSPDGKKLVFAGWDKGHFDIFTINVDGSQLKRITQKRAKNGRWSNNESPSYSPDGRFIAFISNRTGKKEVFISRADGSEVKQITKDPYNYFHIKWSPYLK